MTSGDAPAASRLQGPGLTPRAKVLLPLLILVLAAVTLHRYSRGPQSSLHTFSGGVMGTTWSVKIASPSPGPERAQLEGLGEAVQAELDRIDRLMSTWKPDSELSRFNAAPAGVPFPVSPETLEVFSIARAVSELSGGAFDVTVAPLVAAWGFGANASMREPPDAATLAALVSRVGYSRVSIDPAGTLTRASDAINCDLSAVAKGYAVDRVAELLVDRGHAGFLVEVGGELRARGGHASGAPWRVAVEAPDEEQRRVHAVIALQDLAMATSGDYRNYYELDGRRVSHTVDPRTGRPITHALASVTVVAPSAAQADALATALNVLGPEEGYALATRRDLPAYFILRELDGGFAVRMTPPFERLIEAGTTPEGP